MSDRVTVTVDDGVADVALCRPEKMNALDHEMFVGLIEAGDRVANDPSVRAVVLHGTGRCFCAGLDMASFRQMAGGGRNSGDQGRPARSLLGKSSAASPANFAQRAAWVWTEVPVPVIAAVHGVAFGGGLQLALAADIRIVAPDARLSVLEIKWGLIPDMTGTQTLRRLVPLDVAKELTFTGREISGAEAVRLGLATRESADPLAEATALAREIASKSPDAIRAGKQLLDASGLLDVAQGLKLEARLQASLIGSPNQAESVMAAMEKRPAKFPDPG